MKVECWCYGMQKMVVVEGKIVGKRQADLLRVTRCRDERGCPKRFGPECLIGKLREGRWP